MIAAFNGYQGERSSKRREGRAKEIQIAERVPGPFEKEAWASNVGPVIGPCLCGLFWGMQGVSQKDESIAGESFCYSHGRNSPAHAFAAEKKATGLECRMIFKPLDDGCPGLKEKSRAVRSLAAKFLVGKIELDTEKAGVSETLMVGSHEGVMHIITGPMREDHRIRLTLSKVFRDRPDGTDRVIGANKNGDE